MPYPAPQMYLSPLLIDTTSFLAVVKFKLEETDKEAIFVLNEIFASIPELLVVPIFVVG